MRRIKRTKITVIRTETVFLKIQAGAGAEYARELLEFCAPDSESDEKTVLEIEAVKKDTDDQGEGK